MTKGRKPKPTHLKAVQGNAGKRAINHDEPQADALSDVPLPPEWLDPVGIEMWEKVAPWLVSSKILTESDVPNLEAYCAAYARWRQAEKDIAKNGITVMGMNSEIKNPACTVANESLKQMTTFGSALGLDPASRARLAVPGAKEANNPFKDLVGKKR
ncbi:phage terminase small subunit P27 family [Chromohalobacter sp. TMW 2.2308]|uniref:Phage terminase small subunit P27 family n=1 Tax=Chromohalobacter moromii TaxID=2860329 RepID=A0A9X2X324_9GAMM|nr:phage terminase small subunit P27 family [Chromohalobacter moromii]MCK2042554.1 phage terminase small subunit P27 family [Chromohalobacter moromii]MCT8506149.1 phage terminase small subunit P27 family [Chromohalobacter moromii]